jgi:ribonucleoside-diphosphate reductase alpha chain
VTVNVRDDEWLDVASWVYRNFDKVTGISFLPFSDHTYAQAPYQPIDIEQYAKAKTAFPKEIRWADLGFYETVDGTVGNQTLACSADGCEVVDLIKE